ncbi:MAG: hypothetical protein CL920_02645 [Deltaproteobacteria bacterium]|nr:hypothetical protein [Deltaproteobacteria bacterium]
MRPSNEDSFSLIDKARWATITLAVISLYCAGSMLFFVGEFVLLSGVHALQPASLLFGAGLSCFLTSLTGWRPVTVEGQFLRRLFLWGGLSIGGLTLIWSESHWFLQTSVWQLGLLVGVMIAPEGLSLLKELRELWEGRSTLSAIPLKLLLGWVVVGCLPYMVYPYYGGLGACVVLSACWGILLLCWLRYESWFARSTWLLRAGMYFVCLGGPVWMGAQIFPAMAQPLALHKVLYSRKVGPQSVTVYARAVGRDVHYAVTANKMVVFQTISAYRQAELMVHPAVSLLGKTPKRVLLVGGESGMLLRELAKYSFQAKLTWWDLYPAWSSFFMNAPILRKQNAHIRTQYLRQKEILPLRLSSEFFARKLRPFDFTFDLIFAELPAPNAYNRVLFAKATLKHLLRSLSERGIMVVKLGSPYMQTPLYWCLIGMLAEMKVHTVPLQLSPSLHDDRGFVLISKQRRSVFQKPLDIPVPTRFLRRKQTLEVFSGFSKDTRLKRSYMTRQCAQYLHN